MTKIILLVAAVILLSACASVEFKPTPYEPALIKEAECYKFAKRRNIAIFMDGTSNSADSETNVARLYNLANLQQPDGACPKNYTLYVKGVGTAGPGLWKNITGMTGLGIRRDVRQAYSFITEHYRGEQDKIYIFGFSRGATAARILTSLLYHAGTVDLSDNCLHDKDEFIRNLYNVYKKSSDVSDEKVSALNEFIGLTHSTSQPTSVEFLGLWDTVSALGFTHFGEDKAALPAHYADQLCNVEKAVQALAIDDNRAKMFTPALLKENLLNACPNKREKFDQIVEQAWFSGAHADVGGGYLDTDLSGVSLNWMLERLQAHEKAKARCSTNPYEQALLIPNSAGVFESPLGKSHDASANFVGGFTLQNRNRDIPEYIDKTPNGQKPPLCSAGKKPPVIHESVRERLSLRPKLRREFDWFGNYCSRCFKRNHLDNDQLKNAEGHTHGQCNDNTHYLLELIEGPTDCPTVWHPPEEGSCESN